MRDALIGYSGFVGSTLLKQRQFGGLYRSTTITEARGKSFDLVVCAGAPAQKWIANRDPDADLKNIEALIGHLKTITCQTFILISTVDVFKTPIGVDESTVVEEDGLHAYGRHRRLLEKFVESHFTNPLIVRLPGLVGPGLRKNVIFDFLNSNNLETIDSRGVFQFYPMVNLWYDIQLALQAKLPLIHLAAAPVKVADISLQGFGKSFAHELQGSPARYDMRTKYAELFGIEGHYQYGEREVLQAVRSYAQYEPHAAKSLEKTA
jgi:hypothetical protein